MDEMIYRLGIDIGSTTVKIALIDKDNNILFSDYERHFADISKTLEALLNKAIDKTGDKTVRPVITGSGGLTLANHLHSPFVQEVIAVSTSLETFAPKTDVAIELVGKGSDLLVIDDNSRMQSLLDSLDKVLEAGLGIDVLFL